MKFKIYKHIDDTELFIYEFFYYEYNNYFIYEGMMISRRNDKDDVWGHHWEKYFIEKKKRELQEYEDIHDFYPDGWDYDPLQKGYDAIQRKYNPIINKTKTGKPYYEAVYSSVGNLPKPLLTEEEILEKLKIAVAAKFKDVKLKLYE